MNLNLIQDENAMMLIPDLGPIGAGSVVEFIPTNRLVLVPRPANYCAKDIYFSHTVCGDSLIDPERPEMAIYDGDSITFKANVERCQIAPDDICCVHIFLTGELLAKKVVYVSEDELILRAANPIYEDLYYSPDDIEIQGVIESFKRKYIRH